MATAYRNEVGIWTAIDVAENFGAIPLNRVLTSPPPGRATLADVVAAHDRDGRLCELIDGILVEKTMGSIESYLAGLLVTQLNLHVRPRKLGTVLAPDGMLEILDGQVRLPDVAFISIERLPRDRALPTAAIWTVAPDLAIEVISRSNTDREMERKLSDYFAAGVRLVWYVYPASRSIRVFVDADNFRELRDSDVLDGGEVLPGFQMPLAELFEEQL